MQLMKRLRDQTWEDLRYFVIEREKKPWRNWDRHGFNYKPEITDKKRKLIQIIDDIDNCLMCIQYVEPRFKSLITYEIPPYNCINAEMIQFCTDMFQSEGWLSLFSLKQHRKKQANDTREYVANNPNLIDQLGKTLK